MMWLLLTVLVVLWAIGFTADPSGPAIHLLLIVAALVFVIMLVRGRKMA
jgi:hypothetical protein